MRLRQVLQVALVVLDMGRNTHRAATHCHMDLPSREMLAARLWFIGADRVDASLTLECNSQRLNIFRIAAAIGCCRVQFKDNGAGRSGYASEGSAGHCGVGPHLKFPDSRPHIRRGHPKTVPRPVSNVTPKLAPRADKGGTKPAGRVLAVGKFAGKSMVGVTGFEPATPTSRT